MQHHDDVDAAAELEVLSSHDAGGPRHWWSRPLVVLGLVLVALVVGTNTLSLVRQAAADDDWPTSCGIDENPDWCAEPSAAMTDPDLAALAQAHCPALADLDPSQVVPQPLTPIGPSNSEVVARTTGTVTDGSEQSLLGRPGMLSWVTRQVGGEDDGRVRISCLDGAGNTPGLQLEAEQFRSAVAAIGGNERRVDMAAVAQDITTTAHQGDHTGSSFGFLTCDTGSLDLDSPRVGRTFSCAVEVYGWHGLGAYRATYRVTDEVPYFTRVGTT